MRATVTNLLIALAITIAPASAAASGTAGGYSGGYDPVVSVPRDPAAEAFSRGKSMLKKRVACKTCAFPGGVQDRATALAAAMRIRAGEFELKTDERNQVLFYLSRRFGA